MHRILPWKALFICGCLLLLGACRKTVQEQADARMAVEKPSAVSITPSSGTGLRQDFRFVVSDPRGYKAVDVVLGMVNKTLSFTGGCQFRYEQSTNALSVYSDEKQWLPPVAVGNEGAFDNGLCAIDAKNATVSGSGNSLTLSIPLSFSPRFAGTKALFLLAQRGPYGGPTASSDWQIKGSWIVR